MEYEDLRPLINVWETKCESMVVVQHPPDGKTKRIHCHILIDSASGENWFREAGKATIGEFFKRGNYWLALRVQKGEFAGKPISRGHTLVYMIKGKYEVKFAKNFSKEELDESRLLWVDSAKSDKTGDNSERLITEIMSKFNLKTTRTYYREDDDIELGQCKYNLELLFDNVRNVAWKKLWGEHRRAPQPWHYKNIATTVFMRICEDNDCFEKALMIVQERWY